MSEETTEAQEPREPAGPDDGTSAAEHLENSKRLAAEAHEGWEQLPTAHEADDARHHGDQGRQAPAD